MTLASDIKLKMPKIQFNFSIFSKMCFSVCLYSSTLIAVKNKPKINGHVKALMHMKIYMRKLS